MTVQGLERQESISGSGTAESPQGTAGEFSCQIIQNFVGTDTEESERNHVVLLRQALIDMPK